MNNIESCFVELGSYGTTAGLIAPCTGFLGINAPRLLWVGCFCLVVGFIIVTLIMLGTAWLIRRDLKQLSTRIVSLKSNSDGALDSSGLVQLRNIMQGSSMTKDAWNEFEETLFKWGEGEDARFFNTCQADTYFSDRTILSGRINLRFYGAIPGILTSTGLLLTFIGILIGLHHIKPDPIDPSKLRGVEDLVYSLSGKFISSICALVLAVIFTIIEKPIEGSLTYYVHSLIASLNRTLTRKSSEHIQQDIHHELSEQKDILLRMNNNMEAQSNVLTMFGADLSGSLKQGVSESLEPSLNKIAEAMDALKQQKSESLTDSLGQIISEFKSALLGTANNDIQTLGVTLTRTADMMSAMNEQSRLSQERMGDVIQSLDAAFSKQSSTGDEQLARLVNTMQVVCDKLEMAASQSSGNMESSVTQLLDRLHDSFTSQAAEMSRRNDELSVVMKGMLDQVQQSLSVSSNSVVNTVSDVIEKSSEWSQKTNAQFSVVLEEQARNTKAVNEARESLNVEMLRRNDELSAMMRGMLEQVHQSLNNSSNSVATTVSGVLEKSSEWNEKTTAQFSAVLEEQTRNAKAVNDARDALNGALEIFKQAVNEGASTLKQMGSGSASIKDGVTVLNGAVSNLGKTQDKVSGLASLVEKNAENLRVVIENQKDIVDKYQAVVGDLDKTLSSVLIKVQSGLENYSAGVKGSLERTLGQFDTELGNATSRLGATVRDLTESLDSLVDITAQSRGNGV